MVDGSYILMVITIMIHFDSNNNKSKKELFAIEYVNRKQ